MEEELAKKAEILSKLAQTEVARMDYDASLSNAESALELYEKLGDKHNVVAMHMHIQMLYTTGGWGGAKEDKALEHLDSIAALVEEDPDSVDKALVYQRTARVYLHRGQPAITLTWAQRAVDMFTRLGVAMGTSLGTAWTYTGRIDEGIAYNENNWAPVLKAGNPLVIGILGGDLCLTLALVRDIPRARVWGETILPEVTKFGIPSLEVSLRRPLALVYALSGEVAKGEETCQAVESMESKVVLGALLEDTAGVGFHYLRQGEWDRTREYLEWAIPFHQDRNNLAAVGACCLALGSLNLELGDYPKAEELLLRSLDICQKGGNLIFEFWVLPVLAELYLKMGQPDKAGEYVGRGFELLKPDQNWYGLPAPIYLARGMLATARRDWDTATESFGKAIQVNRQHQLPWDEAKTLYERALMYLARGQEGDRERAHADLDEALAIFQRVGARKDVEKVLGKKEMLGA